MINLKSDFVKFCKNSGFDDKIREHYIDTYFQVIADYLFKTHKLANTISFSFNSLGDVCGSPTCGCHLNRDIGCNLFISNEKNATAYSMFDKDKNRYVKDAGLMSRKLRKCIDKIFDYQSNELYSFFEDYVDDEEDKEYITPYILFYRGGKKKIVGDLIQVFK